MLKGKAALVGGLTVLLFFGTSLSIRWYQQQCPARAYMPLAAFPVPAEGIGFQSADAVAQWTRKYNLPCQTCHTAIPRLTPMGEQFAMNGYQMPETEDGDETKTEVNEGTFIDKVSNLFGFRISFTPVEVTTKALNIDGNRKLRYNFGVANWLQLFTAGSIFKNASIFSEFEINGENGTTYSAGNVPHLNWFTLGYHNLFKTSWLNIRAGKLSMMNWHAQTGRLRMIPNINIAATNAQTSLGNSAAAEDQIRMEGALPSLELYGYKKWFLYSMGVSNGARFVDANQYKNFFGTLRFMLPEGPLAGSAISAWGLWGRDTANSGTETPIAVVQSKNQFYAASGAANIRWKDLDLIASYFLEKEKNYNLATGLTNTRHGLSGQAGYLISPRWFVALQYDKVQDTQNSAAEFHKISEHVSFMPRQNMRIGLTFREEVAARATGRQHEMLLNIRAMF